MHRMTMIESSAEDFARALGVEVVEVDGLDGECAVYDHDSGVVEICRNCCPQRRSRAFVELLPLLGSADL